MGIKLGLRYFRRRNIKGEENMGLDLTEGQEEADLDLAQLLLDLKGSSFGSLDYFKDLIIYNLL